jgi:hypothetical protein
MTTIYLLLFLRTILNNVAYTLNDYLLMLFSSLLIVIVVVILVVIAIQILIVITYHILIIITNVLSRGRQHG